MSLKCLLNSTPESARGGKAESGGRRGSSGRGGQVLRRVVRRGARRPVRRRCRPGESAPQPAAAARRAGTAPAGAPVRVGPARRARILERNSGWLAFIIIISLIK